MRPRGGHEAAAPDPVVTHQWSPSTRLIHGIEMLNIHRAHCGECESADVTVFVHQANLLGSHCSALHSSHCPRFIDSSRPIPSQYSSAANHRKSISQSIPGSGLCQWMRAGQTTGICHGNKCQSKKCVHSIGERYSIRESGCSKSCAMHWYRARSVDRK